VLPVAIVTGVLAFLIVEEPDLGTSIVVVMAVMSMVFVAGLSWRYLSGFVLLLLPRSRTTSSRIRFASHGSWPSCGRMSTRN
jgi:cell division protein FtsW (lipid II flippase)